MGEVEATVVEATNDEPATGDTDESVTVIVDTTGDDDADGSGESVADAMETEREIETAVDVALLARDVRDLQERVTMMEFAAETSAAVTEAVAEEVSEIADVVTETAADTADADIDGDGKSDDIPDTARKHWLFRTREEWKGNK